MDRRTDGQTKWIQHTPTPLPTTTNNNYFVWQGYKNSVSQLVFIREKVLFFCGVTAALNWARSRRCACLVTWFCYQMIAKNGNKKAIPLWPGPHAIHPQIWFSLCCALLWFGINWFYPNPSGLLHWHQHIEAETKLSPFRRQHFHMHFVEWTVWIAFKISVKFVPKVPINNTPVLIQIMAWRWPDDKP